MAPVSTQGSWLLPTSTATMRLISKSLVHTTESHVHLGASDHRTGFRIYEPRCVLHAQMDEVAQTAGLDNRGHSRAPPSEACNWCYFAPISRPPTRTER